MEYTKNMVEIMTITGMTSEGNGVSNLKNNMVVFTPMTAIGDICEIKLVQIRKNFAYGKLEKIIEKSSSRISNDCQYFGPCGGCSYRHIDYQNELLIKKSQVDQNLRRLGEINIETEQILPSPLVDEYRNKASYPIRLDENNQPCIGFFARRSHRIIDVEDCKLQPRFFCDIVRATKDFIIKENIPVYNEEKKTGLLRHLYIRYGKSFDETMVTLVINGDFLPKQEVYLSMLKSLGINIPSVILNINKTHSNVILGKKNLVISGKDNIKDSLFHLDFKLSPSSFYQVNKEGAENIYKTASNYAKLDKDDILLDLYCGAGTIGLFMADEVKKVIGVDIVADAVLDARKNAKINNIKNAQFICADVSNIESSVKDFKPTVVILDPPRKGSDEKTLRIVAGLNPKKIIMISCNSATLSRDLKFLDTIGYKSMKACAVDMFPRTTHVETVVLMSRVEK